MPAQGQQAQNHRNTAPPCGDTVPRNIGACNRVCPQRRRQYVGTVRGDPQEILQPDSPAVRTAGKYIVTHRFLRAVCHYAEKHKLLTDNPIDAVRAPKIDAEIYVFSEEESARFIRAVMREKDIRVKTALLILIYLGLRKGELCGLTWGSVDLGKGIVHVAQQLKEKSGEGLILGKLKTKESKADLPLSPMLAEVLAEYRQWWNEHKAMYGDAWRGEWECLFVGDDGTPLNPSTINEWLDKLTERNGLPHVTVHSLRHLCATLLIRTHADPKTVQTILRHANVSTTLNIYAKVFDSTQMEAIGRVQASLENMLKESCSSSAQV